MGHTVRFEWELPEPLLGIVAKDQAAIADEVKQAAVLDCVHMHRISWRKGPELLGMALCDFMWLMSEHKVLAADYEAGWLEEELAAFKDTTSRDES